MDGHEVVAEFGEQPDGHGASADMGAGAALGGDRTAHEELAVLEFGARLARAARRRCVRRHDYPPLHHGGLGARAYERRVGAPAEQQPEAGDDHGLARSGLTGHRGEAGGELDDGVVDHAQGPDPHLLQHGYDHTQSAGVPPPLVRVGATARERAEGAPESRGSVRRAAPTRHRERELGDEPVREGRVVQTGQPYGQAPLRTSTRAPAGSSTLRRPSHHITPCGVCGCTSTASTESGAVTSGLANSACALIGTINSASTSGHTTGPPAENA